MVGQLTLAARRFAGSGVGGFTAGQALVGTRSPTAINVWICHDLPGRAARWPWPRSALASATGTNTSARQRQVFRRNCLLGKEEGFWGFFPRDFAGPNDRLAMPRVEIWFVSKGFLRGVSRLTPGRRGRG